MRTFTAGLTAALLAFRVLNNNATLGAFHIDDDENHGGNHDQQAKDEDGAERAGAAQFQRARNRRRQVGHNAGEDNQRNAVADTALGNLFAQPHQEHGAAGQRHHGGEAEEPATFHNNAAGHAFQANRDAISLHHGDQHGQITGVLVDPFTPAFAFFFHLLQRRRNRRHQLHDNRSRNVRHDIQGEDGHARQRTTGEHVKHPEQAARVLIKQVLKRTGIDARKRDIRPQPVHNQCAQGKPNTFLKFGRLLKGAKVRITGSFVGSRCHRYSSPPRRALGFVS